MLPKLCALFTWKACKDLSGADTLEAAKEEIRHSRTPTPADGGRPA